MLMSAVELPSLERVVATYLIVLKTVHLLKLYSINVEFCFAITVDQTLLLSVMASIPYDLNCLSVGKVLQLAVGACHQADVVRKKLHQRVSRMMFSTIVALIMLCFDDFNDKLFYVEFSHSTTP